MRGKLTVTINAGHFRPHRNKEELIEEMQENSLRAMQAENLGSMLLQAGFHGEKEILEGMGPEGQILYRFAKDYPSEEEAEAEIFALIPYPGQASLELGYEDRSGNTLFKAGMDQVGMCSSCGQLRVLQLGDRCRGCLKQH